jgi:hypothetical protein
MNRMKKSFDCIKYKDKVQTKIFKEIKKMNPKEEIDYFRKMPESGILSDWWNKVKVK